MPAKSARRLTHQRVSHHVAQEIANKLDEWFKAGLQDWDISRDAPYFGFEIPGRPGKYFYVWLDAPIGYMASTMDYCRKSGRSFEDYWLGEQADVVHFIGKDIVYFHALFWPAMLMGSGYRTPTRLIVHGFLTVDGEKMSKSRGTFINAATYLRHLDPQYLRYYYAAKVNSTINDLDLNFDDFTKRVNADLVNTIANIPSRLLAILHKHCGGRLGRVNDEGRELLARMLAQSDAAAAHYEQREFGQVARAIEEIAGSINIYISLNEPWSIAGSDPAAARQICTNALNGFKIVATLLQPILPEFARKVSRMLQMDALTWQGLKDPLEERQVGVYERLVERVDRKKVEAIIAESRESLGIKDGVKAPSLTLDALIDCDFEIWEVSQVAPAEGSDTLVNLTLQSGDEKKQVLAGLGGAALHGLAGRRLLVLSNLEPRNLRGHLSSGMVLAFNVEGKADPLRFENARVGATLD